MKTFFHVDMDAFFVSVEELFDPSLKGKPSWWAGGPTSAAWFRRRPMRRASSACTRPCRCAPPTSSARTRIFVDGHPERYREYSPQVFEVLKRFSPQVEMASIDEAYLDMTGTERLHGPPLRAAHALHEAMRAATRLNCSIGIATSRLVAKIASDQAKPNGVLWVMPGQEARFLAPLDVRKIPGVGKVTEKNLHALGIHKVGDLARFDETFLESRFGKWGLALAGKARGVDAGGWFDGEVGAGHGSQIHQPRAHVRRGHRRRRTCSKRRWRACPRWWGAACASTGCTRAPSSSSCATRISRPSRAPTRSITPRRSIPRSSKKCARCFGRTGERGTQSTAAGRARVILRRRRGHSSICWPRTSTSAGNRLSPRPTVCATSTANPPSRWHQACVARFRERTHENPAGLPGKPK